MQILAHTDWQQKTTSELANAIINYLSLENWREYEKEIKMILCILRNRERQA